MARKNEVKEELQEGNSSQNKDVLRAIQSAKLALKKKFGNDVFSEKTPDVMPSVSTGSTKLDTELGNEGLVLGRIHEIFGDSGSGKSTTCILLCINAMRQYPDKSVLYLDYEQAMDTRYAQQLGLDVDSDRFVFAQPTSAEEGFEIIDMMMSTNGFSICVVDSVPAMLTQQELEKGYDEFTIGSKAKFLSTSIPKLLEKCKHTNTSVIFVNQVRTNIGSYGGGSTTPGGKALPFYCTSRLEIKRTQILTKKEIPYGQTVRFNIRKNKVGRPFGVVETDLIFGKGFNPILETVDLAIQFGVIRKSASWLKINHGEDELVLQGRENAVLYYESNEEHYNELYRRVMSFKEQVVPIKQNDEEQDESGSQDEY